MPKSRRARRLVIVLSGLHGSGKSTYAKALAEELGLRLVSAGSIFRQMARERGLTIEQLNELAEKERDIDLQIDKTVKEEARKGSVVLEGHLAGWIVSDLADLKIFLTAPKDVRARRISERNGIPLSHAKELISKVERMEVERWKELYDVDLKDLSIYDLILNTGLLPLSSNLRLLKQMVKELIKGRKE